MSNNERYCVECGVRIYSGEYCIDCKKFLGMHKPMKQTKIRKKKGKRKDDYIKFN